MLLYFFVENKLFDSAFFVPFDGVKIEITRQLEVNILCAAY